MCLIWIGSSAVLLHGVWVCMHLWLACLKDCDEGMSDAEAESLISCWFEQEYAKILKNKNKTHGKGNPRSFLNKVDSNSSLGGGHTTFVTSSNLVVTVECYGIDET